MASSGLRILACGVFAACLSCGPKGWEAGPEHPPGQAAPEPEPLAPSTWGSSTPSAEDLVVYTDPGELPFVKIATDGEVRLPLRHTHVEAKLTGFVAEVEVAQTYENPHEEPIEVVYVFPLPENSAVHGMEMVIGERRIEATIDERNAARRAYVAARRSGHTAALLEQERPNVFTQSVANIAPGSKIDVVVRYVQDLTYDAGAYEFVFPLVVGPRYFPGEAIGGDPSGTGTARDTNRVPDASRVSPPIVGRGQRSGQNISIEVEARAGQPITQVATPTHEVVSRTPGDGSLRVTLAEKDSVPNRDFVLRYRAVGQEPRATLYTSSRGAEGFFSLVLHPPEVNVDELVGRRELIFVVDVSGSMSGTPLRLAKSAMRQALAGLRPVDTFNLITFAGDARKAFERPHPANRTNVEAGLRAVDGLEAGGGTEMLDAIDAALRQPVESGRDRYVFFLTDGFVGNEDEIIAASKKFVRTQERNQRRARVFGMGTGSSPNRYLLDGISRAGQGVAVYTTTREDPARAVNQFYRYIDRVILSNVRIDWNGAQVSDVLPRRVPDLFASHPVVLHGRFRGKLDAPEIEAIAGKQAMAIDVVKSHVAGPQTSHSVLGKLWARSRVTELQEDLWDGSNAGARSAITELGMKFGLVTPFTSFIAVDRSRTIGDGTPRRILQAVDEPEGVDVDMAGGRRMQPPAAGGQPFAGLPLREEQALDEVCTLDPDACAAAEPEPSPGGEGEQLYAVQTAPGMARKRGCGCRTVGSEGRSSAVWFVLALALLSGRRRRTSTG